MFVTIPDVTWSGDKKFPYRLTSELVWESEELGQVTVPENFLTDFASVPRIPFIHSWVGGRASLSAVLHDYLYTTAALLEHPTLTRKIADKEFLKAMIFLDDPSTWAKRRAMYRAVRVGGAFSYLKRTAEETFYAG